VSRFHPRAVHVLAVSTATFLVMATIWWSKADAEAAAQNFSPATLESPTTALDPATSSGSAVAPRILRPIEPPKATAAQEQALASEVRRLVSKARGGPGPLQGTEIAVSIRACDDGPGPGRELLEINGDRPLLPASNMKLISTGAALHVLGPEFSFETRIRGVRDTFIVIGDGDPSLADPVFFSALAYQDADGTQHELDEESILGFWADAIVEAAPPDGRVTLLVDDSIFESRLWNDGTNGVDGWNPHDRLRGFSAEVTGLNFHRNTIHFRPTTSGSTRPNWDDMRPRLDSMLQAAQNESQISKKVQTAWILRSPESDLLTFKGEVKPPKQGQRIAPLEVTVHDPAMQFLRVLADRVTSRGVTVERIGRTADGRTAGGTDVGPVVRMPLGPIIEHCNETSQNLYAESLLKRSVHAMTGRPGSWADADASIERIAAKRLGDAAPSLTKDIRIEDGSGLSRRNLMTTEFLTAWLDSFHDDPKLSEVFVESLARGGEEGTLKSRFTELRGSSIRVDAKTGFMTGVSCLSGFVTSEDGRRWSFSVFCNGFKGTSNSAKRLQDAIVMAIADHIE
jgi:serine-type D-Ala-D-Ala carboxypeptidase/endopeptidase (penicillin-binding protein 4)